MAIPEKGNSPERVMDLLEDVALATPRTASRRFFNQLFAGRHDIASAAEIVAVLLNFTIVNMFFQGLHSYSGLT